MNRNLFKIKNLTFGISGILFLNSCGGSLTPTNSGVTESASSSAAATLTTSPSARVIFNQNNFVHLEDFITPRQTSFTCLGDVVKVFYTNGPDYTSSPSSYPINTSVTDDFYPTTRPGFLKNVSVDVTQTYFPETESGVVPTDNCSYRNQNGDPGPSACADFDLNIANYPAPTPYAAVSANPTATPAPTPSSTPYFNTGYYHTRDDYCTDQGPTLSADPSVSKSYVGGVSIDIDRTQLGSSEDLLLIVTYLSLSSNASYPTVQGASDETILAVSMVGTGLALSSLIEERQPRAWLDSNTANVPIYSKNIATLRDPFHSLRSEEVYVPLSSNGLVDRIRIDRIRGSYILYQIDVYRLGNRSN